MDPELDGAMVELGASVSSQHDINSPSDRGQQYASMDAAVLGATLAPASAGESDGDDDGDPELVCKRRLSSVGAFVTKLDGELDGVLDWELDVSSENNNAHAECDEHRLLFGVVDAGEGELDGSG